MGRTKGIREEFPRRFGGGNKRTISFSDKWIIDPDGFTSISLRIPNRTLKVIESLAKKDGISVQQWIRTHGLPLEMNL